MAELWLFQPCAEAVVRAFMTSQLDDCNVLVYGLPVQRLRRLQLLGDGAKALTLLPWPPHVGLVLGDLGWLRVKHQLDLKIALMAYNAEYNVGSAWFYLRGWFLRA